MPTIRIATTRLGRTYRAYRRETSQVWIARIEQPLTVR